MLRPGEHIVVDGCPGLRLVASASGRAWVYRYKSPVDGRMRQIKIGQWPAVPISGAATKWQALKDLRDSGQDPAQDKKAKIKAAKASVYTVANAVEDYITGHLVVNREAKGAKAVAARLRAATASIAKMPAASITRGIAFDLISGLAATPVAAKSVRNELGGAWDLALDSGRLTADAPNWWRQILSGRLRSQGAVRAGVHKGTVKRVLSDAEIRILLAVDMPKFSQQVQDFLVLQLWTCTRGGEIVQMHRDHITSEPDGWWWNLPKVMTKGKNRANATDLRVPLAGCALAVVQRLMAGGGGWLMPSVSRAGTVGPQQQTYMQTKVNYFQPYCKTRPDHVRDRLTVTHWSPHDLRRTGRTLLAQLGCPTDVAESILGHIQPGIQGTYNLHKYDAERRVWLTKLAEHLEGL